MMRSLVEGRHPAASPRERICVRAVARSLAFALGRRREA